MEMTTLHTTGWAYDPQLLAKALEGRQIASVAQALGVAPKRLYEWRSGQVIPKADTLSRIANVLKMKPGDFYRLA